MSKTWNEIYGSVIDGIQDREKRNFFRAVASGDLGVVRNCVSGHSGIDTAVEGNWTALYIAIWDARIEIVRLLLQNGAATDTTMRQGVTPLWLAAAKGNYRVVKCLLQHGANVNCSTDDGVSPLLVASEEGHADVVKVLLDAGANVHAAHLGNGTVPMDAAVWKGHSEIERLLRANGA